MNNWRLLLLAVVAVLQPIGSFTEQYLIDGQECCDHGSDIRANLYGTFRKSVRDQRLTSPLADRPDIRENRRYDTNRYDGSPLLRRSVERTAAERRFLADRERFSRHHEGRQRQYSESTNLEQSRIRDAQYERASFVPTNHVSIDASRLSRTERASRDLNRDNRDAGPERRMKEVERRDVRLIENRRINNERDSLRTNLREKRASTFKERRSQENRFSVLRAHPEKNSDDRITSQLHESREQRIKPQKSINLARNRINERADQRRERETNRMSEERVASRLRESREQRLESQRVINLAGSIRSVQSRNEDRTNERVEQRQERETNRMSDSRVASRLRESWEQRLEPQRTINLARNIRSVQSRIEGKINERVEQRRERETNRMSDDRVASRLRESREQRLEPQRAINLVRNIRSVQSRDANRVNERSKQRRERETNRISDDRVVSRMRETREQTLERESAINLARNSQYVQSRDEARVNERVERRDREINRLSEDRVMIRLGESRVQIISPNIRSVQSRDDNKINERTEQRREREINRMPNDRVVSRLREAKEQRLVPQQAASLSRNIRFVQRRDDNRINERGDQRLERNTNRMSDDRVMTRLHESREQRPEPQKTSYLARNIRSVQRRIEDSANERPEQRRERDTSRMYDNRDESRLRKSRQSPELRLESQRMIRQSRDSRSEQSRYEDRVNERREQVRDTSRMSEGRLMSRLRESRQSPEERLDRRTVSLSRIDDMRNRQEATRRQSSRINERSAARERNIRESSDRMAPENRDAIRELTRISRTSERNDEVLHDARRVSAERRQDAYRVSRIVIARDTTERYEGERNRDFQSSQREVTRDRRNVERADSRRQIEVNRERATREVSRNFQEQKSRSTIPATLRDVRNEREFRYRGVSNREHEIQRELQFENSESKRHESEIRLKSFDMVMERIDRARESRKRIQSDRISTVRETLIQDKSEASSDMNWQYLFYTLQGAYLCGLLVQMLTEKSMKSKTSNFSWWNPVSNNLVKVD